MPEVAEARTERGREGERDERREKGDGVVVVAVDLEFLDDDADDATGLVAADAGAADF